MGKGGAARDSRVGLSCTSETIGLHAAMRTSQPFAAAGHLRKAVTLRTATALAGGLLAAFALAAPAIGQTTQGGAGGQGNASGAPAGGSTSATGPGLAGSNAAESYEGAGGGGAGVTGGKGGD